MPVKAKGQNAPKKKTITRKKPPAVKTVMDFRPFIELHRDSAYELSDGSPAFRVETMMIILHEACREWKLNIVNPPAGVNVGGAHHTVIETIKLVDPNDGSTVAQASGASTKYAYDYSTNARFAATEMASTIALGKALARLGLSPTNSLYSEEEMTVFAAARKDAGTKSAGLAGRISKIALMLADLDEDTKREIRIRKITPETALSLINPDKDSLETLKKRLYQNLFNKQVEL